MTSDPLLRPLEVGAVTRGRAEAEWAAVTGQTLQQRRGRGHCGGRGRVLVPVLEIPGPASTPSSPSAQKVAVKRLC